jgi:hypothetical protein
MSGLSVLRSRATHMRRASRFWGALLAPIAAVDRKINARLDSTANPTKTPIPQELVAQVEQLRARRIDGFVLSPGMVKQQNARVATTLATFLADTGLVADASIEMLTACVSQYRDVYAAAPVTANSHGVNFPAGLALFVLARCLRPRLIVESGVFKGLSSYLLATAVPDARLIACDPNMRWLRHRMPGVTYHAGDWMEVDIEASGPALAYFDDHQNQAMRVIQAHRRGFRHLIFDDSWPIETISGCGGPPLPSIDMVMDDTLLNETVTWIEGESYCTYVHGPQAHALCAKARALIRAAFDVPLLHRDTGVAPTSAMKLVILDDPQDVGQHDRGRHDRV